MTSLPFNSSPFSKNDLPTLLIIPSGMGCSVGGYAGDAIPAARLLAAASECLITHPNVMNAASLYWTDPKIQYVEGYALDRFASGEIALQKVRQQKIGLILDDGLEPELRQRHLHVVDACRASLGLDIKLIVTTKEPLRIKIQKGASGASWGALENPDLLLDAGEKVKALGATAIAVVTRFPDDLEDSICSEYRNGKGVDIYAGAEAVISHLLVKQLGLPCAHAPAFGMSLMIPTEVDPRTAAEEIGHTFLPCVLVGLSKSPNLIPLNENRQLPNHVLLSTDLGAVVAPDGALGGEAVLASLQKKIPLIIVSKQTESGLNCDSLKNISGLDLDSLPNVFKVRNYVEAAGFLLLLKEGINPESVYRPILKANINL